MTQWINVLAAQPNALNSILGINTVEVENSSDLCICSLTHTLTKI